MTGKKRRGRKSKFWSRIHIILKLLSIHIFLTWIQKTSKNWTLKKLNLSMIFLRVRNWSTKMEEQVNFMLSSMKLTLHSMVLKWLTTINSSKSLCNLKHLRMNLNNGLKRTIISRKLLTEILLKLWRWILLALILITVGDKLILRSKDLKLMPLRTVQTGKMIPWMNMISRRN